MRKNMLIATVFAVMLYVVPHYTQAATVSGLDFVYDTEFRFESTIKGQSVNQGGSVLGVSTDNTGKVKVTTKLDKKRSSYFKDISIRPPKDWYITEDAKDWYITDRASEESGGFVTEINNKEMTAGISIIRFDAAGLNVTDYTSEIENVCAQCGYEVLNKGEAKIAGQKGRFVDVRKGDHHFKMYTFISEDTVYFVRLAANENEWKYYQKILEKSAKTLKLRK